MLKTCGYVTLRFLWNTITVQWIDIIVYYYTIRMSPVTGISSWYFSLIIIIIDLITLISIYVLGILHLSVGLGSVRGRNFALSSKVKEHVLGIWTLYDTFVIVLLFAPLLRCFWINLYSLDILGTFW